MITFRFNRRFYVHPAFRSLLGIAGGAEAPTYAELYSGECEASNVVGVCINQARCVQLVSNWQIDHQPPISLVWTLEEKQKLINSIFRGYPVPAVLLAETAEKPDNYEVIDGMQRLHAIMLSLKRLFQRKTVISSISPTFLQPRAFAIVVNLKIKPVSRNYLKRMFLPFLTIHLLRRLCGRRPKET